MPASLPSAGIVKCTPSCLAFYMASGHQQRSHAYIARTLPNEPSPQLRFFFALFCKHLFTWFPCVKFVDDNILKLYTLAQSRSPKLLPLTSAFAFHVVGWRWYREFHLGLHVTSVRSTWYGQDQTRGGMLFYKWGRAASPQEKQVE